MTIYRIDGVEWVLAESRADGVVLVKASEWPNRLRVGQAIDCRFLSADLLETILENGKAEVRPSFSGM